MAAGKGLTDVCRHLEITESSWDRWLAQYGGMKASDAKRLKESEAENARLKKLVANQAGLLAEETAVTVPSAVVAEARRGESRQANLARLLALCEIEELSYRQARDVAASAL